MQLDPMGTPWAGSDNPEEFNPRIPMRLFLTWLLGVPLLVAAMVVARAMTPQGLEVRPRMAAVAQSVCVGKRHIETVAQVVVRNRHRVACDTRSIQR